MRIIAGKYRSRILKSPGKQQGVRPTTDRARETLFNILGNFFDFEEKTVVDLFCGTGSFGIECLSRGAEFAILVDKSVKLAEENVKLLKIEDETEVIRTDALMFLKDESLEVDLIFADAPYDYNMYDKLIAMVMKIDAYFILEHSDNYKVDESLKDFMFKQKVVGNAIFSFFDFRKQSSEKLTE